MCENKGNPGVRYFVNCNQMRQTNSKARENIGEIKLSLIGNVEIMRKREMKVDDKTTCHGWEPNPHLAHDVCGALP